MSNTADQELYQQLTQDIGQWSGATGVAAPPVPIQQAWARGNNMNTLQGQLNWEGANIGYYYTRDKSIPRTTAAQISAAAQADPRWSQLDPLGQEILGQLYNLQAMGYGGNLGQNTPLPVQATPPATTGIQAAPATMTTDQQSAWTQVENTLQQYGFTGSQLSTLSNWVQQEIISGNSAQQITLDLQNPATAAGQIFYQRFPAIETLANEGVAITPAQYISLEQQYANLEQQAGLPPNFASYDQLIANQVSPSEYSARLQQGYLAVANAPQETIQAMQSMYGVTQGQLAAYFLNPTQSEPQLLQQALSAQIAGAANVSGWNQQITQPEALRLAQMGTTYSQAQQGFQTLSGQNQLTQALPGQGTRINFTPDQLLNEQFGSDGQTKLQLEIQAQQQKNYFSQGTGVAGTSTGLTGAGNVQR